MRDHFAFAVGNIARHGDTDVFPFPIENRIFFDLAAEAVTALERIHSDFDTAIHDVPPLHEKALSVVGYHGFRPAAQLDPLWNAYLLGLVTSIADKIEATRVAKDARVVFSYRVKVDPSQYCLFDTNMGWMEFQQQSLALAEEHNYVLCCDISDFYPRVYHHRLENALKKTRADGSTTERIMRLLSRFSGGVSYGLPVGGPAARLLSELILDRTDRMLLTHQIVFCRFVDDYRIFASSKGEAYQALLLLSQILLADEGLTLQRSKTRVLSRDEFAATSPLAEPPDDPDSEHAEARALLRIRLRYDPYSPTAETDYENLKEMISKYDIVGMLAKEVRKARIDESMTRKLIKSIKYLDAPIRQQAVVSLLDSLDVLYPVFSQLMIIIKAIYADLDHGVQQRIQQRLRALIWEKSHITSVPTHLAYALRVLAEDNSIECDAVLARLYDEQHSLMVRRDIILAMAKHSADHWLSNRSKQYATLTDWEKTAMVIGSYVLGDEGEHFRRPLKGGASPMTLLAMQWAESKLKAGAWEVPL